MAVSRSGKWIRLGVVGAACAVGVLTGRSVWSSGDSGPVTEAEKIRYYETQVKPIFEASCVKCHGAEGKSKGGLKMTSRAGLVHGGDTGPAVDLEKPEKSLILKAIGYEDDDLQMPPKEKLKDREIAVIARWVEMGAPWTPGGDAAVAEAGEDKHAPPKVTAEAMKFWSFQPVKRPAVPAVKDAGWVRNPVDAFVLAKLEAAGLRPAAPASKVALLRRAYFDLIGLAPTPAEVAAFEKDASPDAFEKVVDRLLAMPQYGEKWGRHWLDVVRFAETNSFERDGLKPNAWRYRDYVIEAFNQDKPYDQFVREQIAGDELDQVTPESLVATGIYRLGQWDDEPSDREQARYDELDDIVTTVGQGMLGLTLNCARCHDHKIDPIPAKDYYSFMAFFSNITPYSNGASVMQEIVPPDQMKAVAEEREALEARKEDLRKLIAHYEAPVIAKLTPEEREQARRPRRRDAVIEPKVLAATNADDFRHYKNYKAQLKALEDDKNNDLPKALVAKEMGPRPKPTFLLKRGNAGSPGEEVQPGFPQILNPSPAVIPQPKPGQKTSGRRRVLAEWITDAKNPLTARVMVNRIWQHHFGRGIVRSGNDFGTAGDRPTHPELLDWLASEFQSGGWRMKAMHKLIMMSSAYRMSSEAAPEALAKDPMNDHFWRFDMRRLTAEEIRDTILMVTGKLNLKMGGPGIFPTIPQAILAGQSVPGAGWGTSTPEEASRRSVYIHVKRSLVFPLVSAFDGPDTDFSCPSRFVTTQSTQALMMLNSDLINEEAKAFARRLKKEAGDDAAKQVGLALRLALSREPAADEVERGVKFMAALRSKHGATAEVALEQFALMVLNLNEFVYLD